MQRPSLLDQWVGCTVHILNAFMKPVMASLHDMQAVILDVSMVNEKITGMKKAGWMNELRDGYHLEQVFETLFGTFFDETERFVISASKVQNLLATKHETMAASLLTKFATLTHTVDTSGKISFTAFNALLVAFKEIRDMQIDFEHTSNPHMYNILPLVHFLKSSLPSVTSADLAHDMASRVAAEVTRTLHVHLLWWSACILYHGTRGFMFEAYIKMPAES